MSIDHFGLPLGAPTFQEARCRNPPCEGSLWKRIRTFFMLEWALACELAARGDASAGSSDDSAMRTLLHRGDVSRGFSTESARATLLQGGDAFRASSAGLLARPRYKAVMLRSSA